ncbi:TetR/AcrR family transcriptional regulator [Frigoribacterium sp. PhB24]|uniref:TetR/AcrR family transcriptional regulator n=1 Tax=Frigoribacterium sp. PhB24 TaxID=2485204 RepID=UPI000FAD091F|nr:TetR/AcrR family transcriptional regulator [Frigoribacterium sp. PhB24]ROS51667.1 TetR family transcriptional regulator [Frigoribacterium sp. PhB24]
MGRWEPDARGRLLRAAIELFSEHGYDATTSAQIAAHAGLTKTTLFRHFTDKREILFQGQDALVAAAVAGIVNAPADVFPGELVRAGITSLCAAHSDDLRDMGRLLDPLLAATPELRERATFKRSAITEALQEALRDRLGDVRQAGLLADMGVRAYYEGYASWMLGDGRDTLIDRVDHELIAYQGTLAHMHEALKQDRSS